MASNACSIIDTSCVTCRSTCRSMEETGLKDPDISLKQKTKKLSYMSPMRERELSAFKAGNPFITDLDIADYFSVKWDETISGTTVAVILKNYRENNGDVSNSEAQDGLEKAIKYLQALDNNPQAEIQMLQQVLVYICNYVGETVTDMQVLFSDKPEGNDCEMGASLESVKPEHKADSEPEMIVEKFVKRGRGRPRKKESVSKQAKTNSDKMTSNKLSKDLIAQNHEAFKHGTGSPKREDRRPPRNISPTRHKPRPVGRPITNIPGPHPCNICGKTLRHLNALKTHLLTHSEDTPYSCSDCNMCFRQSMALARHRRVHEGLTHQCDECNMSFLHPSDLARHSKQHTGQSRYQCEACSQSFHYTSHLQRHMKIHWKDPEHLCSICGKAFRHPWNLKEHQKVHTGDKNYQCSVCYRTFAHANTARIHYRLHTNERPHQCDKCGKSFIVASHLVKHKRIHSDEEPFQCNICPKGFKWETSLMKHQLMHQRQTADNIVMDKDNIHDPIQAVVEKKNLTQDYNILSNDTKPCDLAIKIDEYKNETYIFTNDIPEENNPNNVRTSIVITDQMDNDANEEQYGNTADGQKMKLNFDVKCEAVFDGNIKSDKMETDIITKPEDMLGISCGINPGNHQDQIPAADVENVEQVEGKFNDDVLQTTEQSQIVISGHDSGIPIMVSSEGGELVPLDSCEFLTVGGEEEHVETTGGVKYSDLAMMGASEGEPHTDDANTEIILVEENGSQYQIENTEVSTQYQIQNVEEYTHYQIQTSLNGCQYTVQNTVNGTEYHIQNADIQNVLALAAGEHNVVYVTEPNTDGVITS